MSDPNTKAITNGGANVVSGAILMSTTIDYYYAVMSGFAYLGEPELRRIADAANATINYKPMDILRVFATTETTPPAKQSPARRKYRDIEIARWAQLRGLPVNVAPKHWPILPATPSRAVLSAKHLGLDPGPLSFAMLRGVWAEDENIADADTIKRIVSATYPDQADEILKLATADTSTQLFETVTDEAIAAGVFGSPTFVIDSEIFFGQDRLDLVAKHLGATA